MKADSIIKELQSKAINAKPIEHLENTSETVNQLVKRLRRLDYQSGKIN